jgi:uncharacterized protein
MPRPKLPRRISFSPNVTYFKPRGIPLRDLEVVSLSIEEIEAYRWRYLEKLDQSESADKMKISTSTYQRILYSAQEKIADALINGKAIEIS